MLHDDCLRRLGEHWFPWTTARDPVDLSLVAESGNVSIKVPIPGVLLDEVAKH